jgi:hypothetical protein
VQRSQRRRPRLELREQGRQVLGVLRAGREDAVVLEVTEEGEGDLRAHGRDLQLGGDEAQVLDGAGAADAAVADEAGGLVVPLGVEVVDRVLEHARRGVVVLGGHEDVAVELGDLGRPALGVVVGVLPERRRHGLVEVRKREVGEVDELVLGVGALGGVLEHPLRDCFSVAARPGAAENDGDLGHGVLLSALLRRAAVVPSTAAPTCRGGAIVPRRHPHFRMRYARPCAQCENWRMARPTSRPAGSA